MIFIIVLESSFLVAFIVLGTTDKFKSEIDCGNTTLRCEPTICNCEETVCEEQPCICECNPSDCILNFPEELNLVIKNETP